MQQNLKYNKISHKVLNVIAFGVTFELLSVTTFGLKWYDR